MTLRKLLEFKIFGVDGFHIEGLFCNIKNLIKQNGSVTVKDLESIKSLSPKKRNEAIETLINDGFIKIDGKNIHDTEKPVELMKILIENSTNEQDIVFEPFAGSGSTLLACEETNRKWVGIEIDKKYCEIIKMRLDNSLNEIF